MVALYLKPTSTGELSFTYPAPDWVDSVVIPAGDDQTYTLPAGVATANFMIFSADGPFYAKPGTSCAIPSASSVDGASPFLNPTAWQKGSMTTITFNSVLARVVTIAFYS